MSEFNYTDTIAVTKLAKKLLIDAGFTSEKPDGPWLSVDEHNWQSYCDIMGGKYTPFPDVGIQPDHIKEEFKKFEEGIPYAEHKEVAKTFNRDMIVAPFQMERGAVKPNHSADETNALYTGRSKAKVLVGDMEHPENKKPKAGEMNYGIVQGSMARFGVNIESDKRKAKAPNKPEVDTMAPTNPLKLSPQVHAKDADGNNVTPGKDILEKVNDPAFDGSAPPSSDDSRVKHTIESAPDTTDLSSKVGTDAEKEKKNKEMSARQTTTDATLSVR